MNVLDLREYLKKEKSLSEGLKKGKKDLKQINKICTISIELYDYD